MTAPAEIVGQGRARAAVDFGIAMRRAGYHLYVMGPPGSGKRSLVRRAISAHLAHDGLHRNDWVYVNNFEAPHQPIALQLAPGRGAQLRADMRALVEELRSTIPAAFESEEYAAELERLNTDFKERAERGLLEVSAEAQQQGLLMIRTPVGFTFAPRKDGEVMSPPEFEALPQAERERLQKAVAAVAGQAGACAARIDAAAQGACRPAARAEPLDHATGGGPQGRRDQGALCRSAGGGRLPGGGARRRHRQRRCLPFARGRRRQCRGRAARRACPLRGQPGGRCRRQ